MSFNEEIDQLKEKYQFNFELIKRLSFIYGLQRTADLIASLKEHTQKFPIRVNTQITTATKLIKTLKEKDIVAEQHPDLEDCILIEVSKTKVISKQEKTVTLNYKRSINHVLVGVGLGSNDFEPNTELNVGDEISLLDKKGEVIANGIMMMTLGDLEAKKKGIAVKIIESKYKIPNINGIKEYLRGQFIPQTIASLILGSSINLRSKDRFLDMNIDSGEILTHIWQRNSEVKNLRIIALRSSAAQISKLNENIKRLRMYKAPIEMEQMKLGAFARKYDRNETFDWIIINPPSSELGLRPKLYEDIKEKFILECAKNQKRYISEAARLIKPGGTIFYTTNSLDPAENEQIIQYAVEELNLKVKMQEIFLGAKCVAKFPGAEFLQYFYPDIHDSQGQFIAKLTK